jgi:hypothetical protein
LPDGGEKPPPEILDACGAILDQLPSSVRPGQSRPRPDPATVRRFARCRRSRRAGSGWGRPTRHCSTRCRPPCWEGTYLDAATGRYPVVCLGFGAAQALGIGTLDELVRIWSAGRWFAVAGMLRPVQLAPEIDRSALIGLDFAKAALHFDGFPTRPYVRADPERLEEISRVLARTVNTADAGPGHGHPAAGRAGRRGWRCRTRPRRCSSASARWRCWSAGWASPT